MNSLISSIIRRQQSIVRKDIQDWKQAQLLATSTAAPAQYLLQFLYKDVMQDALMSSQIDTLRIGKTKGADFDIITTDGTTDEKATALFKDSGIYETLAQYTIESLFYGYSVVELSKTGAPTLIPRENIEPLSGSFLPDCYNTANTIQYRNLREYNRTIIEIIPKPGDLGFINKAVPYVLIKKFALSCWSEFCEIFGMPPRVLKTNTQDGEMLGRAEEMMREIGSAAYFIIDTNEELDFGQAVQSNGDVYANLIRRCDDQISLVNIAAVIGQDTANGNYSKEESSARLLESVVASDKRLVEGVFNRLLMPALARLGVCRDGLRLQISKDRDLDSLWNKTIQALPYYEIDPQWIKDNFGIEVTARKTAAQMKLGDSSLNIRGGSLEVQDFFA
ncbi:MAG: DUF935 family protein [Bacteroidales bacterium]|nr:DUF935 family protein [Bacteroidales bacterium]